MKLNFRQCLMVVVTLTALGINNSSMAASSDWQPVAIVNTQHTGALYLQLDPVSAHPNPDNCVISSWLRVPISDPNKEQFYQMALTAVASGMLVKASVSGCDGSYPKLIYLQIKK